MKIRNGFVSNSSSSSFLVIESGDKQLVRLKKDVLVVDGSVGTMEFGWERTRYHDVYSKINFTYLQLLYVKEYDEDNKLKSRYNKWFKMLEKVIKKETGANRIEWKITTDWKDKINKVGYIDHQSAAFEGVNLGMFKSEKALKTFLFNHNSYIQGGNDNC